MDPTIKNMESSTEPSNTNPEGTVSGPSTSGAQVPMELDPAHGEENSKNVDKPQRVNVCGAERKRRRKARLARETATAATAVPLDRQSPPSVPTGSGGSASQCLPSKEGGSPRGAPSLETGAGPRKTSGPAHQGSRKGAQGGNKSKKPPLTGPASKRQRTPGSTPDAVHASKRPRSGPSRRWQTDYAQVAAEDRSLQVVVSRDGLIESPFTEDQLLEFLDAVGEAITQTPSGSDTPLQFSSTRLWRGQLLVTAANQASRDWLLRSLSNIRPWSDVSLVAFDPALFRLSRALVWVPGKKPRSNEDTLRVLERQNPGLTCSQWRIWERKEEPQGVRFVVGMDEKSISTLRGLNFQPFYSATRAQVTLAPRRKGNAGGTAKAATSTKPPSSPSDQEPKRDLGKRESGSESEA